MHATGGRAQLHCGEGEHIEVIPAARAAARYALLMAKRAGIRKVVKWGGLAVSVLLAIAWVGSCWYKVWWETPRTGLIAVQAGRFSLMQPLWPLGFGEGGTFVFERFDPKMKWWFGWGHWNGGRLVAMPLWAPLLIVACATAVAWRADARARRLARVGACPACGYDRRGLDVGTVCPECGAAGTNGQMVK